MKRGRLPLTALRSFESAGRLLSFTLAAEELFVSQAAISRQVRDLERLLGKPLFNRHARRVTLTAHGIDLLETLTQAFDRIDTRLDEIRGREIEPLLTVNAEPGFAACWLVPHLAEFRKLHAGIDVSVESDARLIEFRTQDAELAIRYSLNATSWPRTQAKCLLATKIAPVLAPMLETAAAITSPRDLVSQTLLHEDDRDCWERWFGAAGLAVEAGMGRGPIFADGGLVLQAALRGHGVMLADPLLAHEEIQAGRLKQAPGPAIDNGAYWLVARDFDQLSAAARAFVVWIQARLAQPHA
ncbi:LysR substrate-binding domain-containing protein [Pararhizobium antarcticum]|uniref:Transcriptional regulator n=1 Tax=Pararhizobium antarcticum TaxID=1798805 RepID=A0A657LUW5_9HYPH|nr:LysR substrate-binding domain-containing protein [Pararhizobium antarcticum]OJF98725.1 transcriptional regulator [Pararhizobium antarcticum]OJF98887.1 transcriptional regulator [Pararhizobium antarcticum]OJF99146.1 transcriptional regulator [Rhizobium sp. 58]